MTLHELEAFKSIDLKEINSNKVIDIDNINIDPKKGKYERITNYLEATQNPYFVKCGNVIVKMSFADTDLTIDECIERYLIECLNERL